MRLGFSRPVALFAACRLLFAASCCRLAWLVLLQFVLHACSRLALVRSTLAACVALRLTASVCSVVRAGSTGRQHVQVTDTALSSLELQIIFGTLFCSNFFCSVVWLFVLRADSVRCCVSCCPLPPVVWLPACMLVGW